MITKILIMIISCALSLDLYLIVDIMNGTMVKNQEFLIIVAFICMACLNAIYLIILILKEDVFWSDDAEINGGEDNIDDFKW